MRVQYCHIYLGTSMISKEGGKMVKNIYIYVSLCVCVCVRVRVCVYVLWRKGPLLHRRMGEDGVLLLSLYAIGGRDPYYMGGV